jgi:hypothetical protein
MLIIGRHSALAGWNAAYRFPLTLLRPSASAERTPWRDRIAAACAIGDGESISDHDGRGWRPI